MKSGIITTVLVSSIITTSYAETAHLAIKTNINVEDFLECLSLADKLIILSIGNLRALVKRPDVATKLNMLDREIGKTFERAYAEFGSRENFSAEQYAEMELQFRQRATLALYALLYAEVQEQLAQEGTEEQKVIFNAQLTPEALSTLMS